MQQGFTHALVPGTRLDIDGNQFAVAALTGHDDLANEQGVAVKPEGHEMGHPHQGLQIIQVHESDFIHLEPVDEAVLLIQGMQRRRGDGAAHGNPPVAEGNGQLQDVVGFVAVKAVLQIEILHLGIRGGNSGIQAGPEGGIRRLENPGTGDQRAEKEIAGRRIPVDGEIEIHRAVRIEPGMILIQNKPVTGLRSQIIDRVENVFRIQPVDRLSGMYNRHCKFLSKSNPDRIRYNRPEPPDDGRRCGYSL